MSYVANIPLTLRLDDGRYAGIPPGGALPSSFPDMVRTLGMLQRAKQVTIVPDDAAPPFEFQPPPKTARQVLRERLAHQTVAAPKNEKLARMALDHMRKKQEAAKAQARKAVARRVASAEPVIDDVVGVSSTEEDVEAAEQLISEAAAEEPIVRTERKPRRKR